MMQGLDPFFFFFCSHENWIQKWLASGIGMDRVPHIFAHTYPPCAHCTHHHHLHFCTPPSTCQETKSVSPPTSTAQSPSFHSFVHSLYTPRGGVCLYLSLFLFSAEAFSTAHLALFPTLFAFLALPPTPLSFSLSSFPSCRPRSSPSPFAQLHPLLSLLPQQLLCLTLLDHRLVSISILHTSHILV